MMQLNSTYKRDDFLQFIDDDFLADFKKDVRPASTQGFSSIQKAYSLGRSDSLDLQVFEFSFEGSPNKRVALTKDAFQVMRSSAIFRALAVFHSPDNKDWRFSLMTATPQPTEKGKVSLSYSNPKRLSFFLGPNAKINTPTKFLISKGQITDFEDLKNRFSIEVVNKEFYKEISQSFTKLVGGLLKLPATQDKSQTSLEFAVRLIGRAIFCWFLREKKSQAGLALMPKVLLSLEAVKANSDYYHKILEPIFFEVLNKPVKSRRDDFNKEPFSSVPYLNGGLFSPQGDDYYKRTNGDFQSQYHNTLIIPDSWFKDFFGILETYNFTIDENTSYDEELSIDPEMLGRIFENLLAEINPETGESARKSTGSYYTPRVIVNYMVDESLLLSLKEQTGINENKLRAIISYDLSDDSKNQLMAEEKDKIIEALEKIKILDPACGSGAFPIGALQKIVFILQQIDPEGRLWFKKQIKNTSPEIRRVVEREFAHKNFDYIRKLGIIRENIYGVDIQPIATEISRLRCFLTLIVDERIQDRLENRGIEPLPNLDFKFVSANSLIGLPKIDLSQQSLFDDYKKIDELKEIRDQYFNASGIEREQLKTEFVTQQKRLVDQLIKEHGFMGVAKAELTQKLTDWEPFTHKSSIWFDPEWMFGIKDGIDIVMANPPYIGEKDHKYLFDDVKKGNLKDFYNGQMDLFYFFFHLSLNLIKDNGVTSLITTNYYPTARGARKLRADFKSRATINKMINFNELKIFESAKGQHNMITILTKRFNNDVKADTSVTDNQGVATGEILHKILAGIDEDTKYYSVEQADLYDGKEFYIRIEGCGNDSSNPVNNVFNKMTCNSDQLINLCNVNVGLYTGADKVTENYLNKYHIDVEKNEGIFIVSKKELDNLKLNQYELSKIVPFYKNSNIHKWFTDITPSLFLINISYPENKNIDFNQIPNLKNHLSRFEPILKGRKSNDNGLRAVMKAGYWWTFTIRQIDFTQPKIVVPQRSPSNIFGYNESPWYTSADVYFITKKDESIYLKYVLALLNSKLYYVWLYHRGKRKGETLELYQKPLSEIPIKKISPGEQKPFIEIADKIISITNSGDYLTNSKKHTLVKEYEKQIDQMVYELYGLTEEEIALLENSK